MPKRWSPLRVFLIGAIILAPASLNAQLTALPVRPPFTDEQFRTRTRLFSVHDNIEVRDRFIQVERIVRLPRAEREPGVATVYRNLSPSLMNLLSERDFHAISKSLLTSSEGGTRDFDNPDLYSPELDEAAKTLSPEAVADKIAELHNSAVLQIAARRRAMHLFHQESEQVAKLIDEDLAAADATRGLRALDVIREMRLIAFGEKVMDRYLSDGPLTPAASKTLAALPRQPRPAKRLVEDIETNPFAVARHSRLLAVLLADSPADPFLLKLVDAPDPVLRYESAYSLQNCSPDPRALLIPKLMQDGDSRSQMLAAQFSFSSTFKDFKAVRPQIVKLLDLGVHPRVRSAVAIKLAYQKDPSAVATLIDLLKQPLPPDPYRSDYLSVDQPTRIPTATELQNGAGYLHNAVMQYLGKDSKWYGIPSPRQWPPRDQPGVVRMIEDLSRYLADHPVDDLQR